MNNSSAIALSARHSERGFSMLNMGLWLAVVGFALWYGTLIFVAHYTNWKVQDVFESVTENLSNVSEDEIRSRLPKLYKVMYLAPTDVPAEFHDNLRIRREGSMLEISSLYTVVIWPLGPVEQVDEDGSYDIDALEGMDILRDKLRVDIEFEPYAISQ